MGKSKNGGGPASGDGRRNNRPPKHGMIKKGEVRNPYGARGKPVAGPPQSNPTNSIDRLFLDEANRIVSHDAGGPVSASRRLVQEEYHDALAQRDQAARVRILARLRDAVDREERERAEFIHWLTTRKIELQDQFYWARRLGQTPPDITPHPDHVQVYGDFVSIVGPVNAAERAWWEHLKVIINIAACVHDIIRSEYRRNPSDSLRQELKQQEAHRRKCMRVVPKGWNWREHIWCRDSKSEWAAQVMRDLREMGYVSPTA